MGTRELVSELTLDGARYRWSIERYPRYTSEGYRGLCVHVEVATGSGRLLVLEFPFEERDHRSMPHHQRPKPSDRELTTHIMGAIGAGWEPSSRGKPFVYAVGRGIGQ
jgi:hypothetical protein